MNQLRRTGQPERALLPEKNMDTSVTTDRSASSAEVTKVYGPAANENPFRVAYDDVVDGLRRNELWRTLGVLDVKRRYRRTLLGPFWASGMAVALRCTNYTASTTGRSIFLGNCTGMRCGCGAI